MPRTKEESAAYSRAWRAANLEKARAKAKAWYHANKEQSKASTRAWCKANPEKWKALQKASNDRNRERINARNKNAYAQFRAEFVGPPKPARARKTDVELREKAKTQSRRWNDTHPGYLAEMYRKAKEAMTPARIANLLKISVADLTPELLALKREQLTLHRLGKQLKAQIKESK